MSQFEERMQALRKRYAERAALDLDALGGAVRTQDWVEVRRIAHGLSGTGAVFGFPEISASGQQLEEAVDADLPVSERLALADALIACLAAAAQER